MRDLPADDEAPPRRVAGPARLVMGRAFWAIAEQGSFALANFAIHFILSQKLEPASFGAFAAALALYNLFFAVQHATLLEPMLVFGASRYRLARWRYVSRVVLRWNGAPGVASAIALVSAGALAPRAGFPEVSGALIALGATVLPVLLFFGLRRLCYLVGKLPRAAAASIACFVAALAAIYGFDAHDRLTVATGSLSMAIGAIAGSLVLVPALPGLRWSAAARGGGGAMLTRHLRYGRWAAGSETLLWLSGALPLLTLPAIGTLEETGSFRLLQLVMMPLYQGLSALGLVALPLLAGSRPVAALLAAALGFTVCAVFYGGVLLAAAPLVERYVFDGHFAFEIDWLGLAALHGVASALAAGAMTALRAFEAPRFVTLSSVVSCVALGAAPWLHDRMGLSGVIVATVAAIGAGAAIALAAAVIIARRRSAALGLSSVAA